MTVAAEKGDRLADPFHGRDHRLPAVLSSAQVLAHPEDEEQAVVRARAEHQHDQQDLGQRRYLQPVMRGSATSGPEMVTARTAGMRVTSGASKARKNQQQQPER